MIWMELCKRDETQAEKVCMDVLPESKASISMITELLAEMRLDICLLPEISAVLNQSDAVCIPLTAAASSILSISIYC